ncbi:hypothetical protein ACIBO1_23820 [Micromonospora sp. NPDC049903]|uniref:hypothetical protein n=1 Tax=Micromonospora sp. NPDC049903 TaxID=3364276 RepID=UPI00379BE2BC
MVVGDDARMRQTALAVSHAGGGPADLVAAIRNTQQTGESGIDRPWQWLTAVCREARTTGDVPLIAAVALFVNIWDTQLRDKVTMADTTDMMLEPPPTEAVQEVYTIAVLALPDHAVNQQVVGNLSGSVRIGDVRMKCAIDVLGAEYAISAEVRAAAQRVLDQ